MSDIVAQVESGMSWKKLLESVSESLNDHIQLRNDYLLAENRILRNQIDGRVQLTDSERKELAAIGAKLGKKALAEIATLAQPDTILAWNRKFSGPQVDTSAPRKSVGRPRVDQEIEDLVLRMARENRSWGYDRIQGALKHLGYTISDQTVGNILKRHGMSPAPERKKTVTWREFVRSHRDLLLATDFFNSEIWSWFGLMVSYLLCFIHFSRHQVYSVGMMLHQRIQWMSSLGRQSLDVRAHVPRRSRLVGKVSRSRAIRLREDVMGHTASGLVHLDERKPCAQDMGKVVFLSTACPGRTRDGPVRRQHRLKESVKGDYRQAA
jgi:transposase